MQVILNYSLYMIIFMVICMPIYLIVRYIFLKKKNIKINKYREIVLLLFVLFLMGLASLTIIPTIRITSFGMEFINSGIDDINIIPFRIIYDTYIEIFKNHNINYFLISFLGNIILFIPIGFFMKILWENLSDKKIILYGFCISLMIEVCQVPLARTTDIDDLLCNTLGVFIGVLFYNRLKKVEKK